MSYESKMLQQLAMPARKEVEEALLRALLKNNGVIKEFGFGEEVVDQIASEFALNKDQRSAFLETVYRKQNRVKKAFLWHRLLFRAADALTKESMVSRPNRTLRLTKRREWMLTEKGFDEALRLCNIPTARKGCLPTKSYEVQKIVKKLVQSPKPGNWDPFDTDRKIVKTTRELALRNRAFRLAVVEAYTYRCAVCGRNSNPPIHYSGRWRRHILFLIIFLAETMYAMESHCVTSIIGHSTLAGSRYWMITGFKFHCRSGVCRPTGEDLKASSFFGRFGPGAPSYVYRGEEKFIPITMRFAGTEKTCFTVVSSDSKNL